MNRLLGFIISQDIEEKFACPWRDLPLISCCSLNVVKILLWSLQIILLGQ